MKNSFLITLSLFLFVNANAQRIKYESSLSAAKQKSATSGKPLFLHIHIGTNNIPLASGFYSQEVGDFYNKNFINYLSFRPDSSIYKLMREYNVNSFPTYLFLDKDANLVHRATRGSSSPSRYLLMGDSAKKMATSDKGPAAYKQKYQQGLLDQQGLKEYITLRKNLGYRDNADLIEDYVNTLNIKSLDDYNTVLFILTAGPYAYGKAYKLAHINQKIIDSIYKKEPLETRIDMNSRISDNTYRKAVKMKDVKLAEAAAGFSRNTWGSNYREAYKNYEHKMLVYYKAVKDTTNYLRRAMHFFDNYSKLSLDSIKKHDEKQRKDAIEKTSRMKAQEPMYESSSLQSAVISESSIMPTPIITVASILNNAAYDVYLTKTNNQDYLERAIKWSRKSIELSPVAAAYDTLAHLLYRYKFFDEAEATQEKAVLLSKKGTSTATAKRRQVELKKIRERKL